MHHPPKPRIAVFATSYLPFIGGAQIAVHESAKRIPELEFHVFTARLQQELASHETIDGVHVHRFGTGRPTDKWLLPLLAPFAARRFGPFFRIWGLMAEYGGMAATAFALLNRRRIPFLLTLQEGGDPAEMEREAGLFLHAMRFVVSRADSLHTISQALMAWGEHLGFRGAARAVVPNGVDLDLFSRKPDPGRLDDLRHAHMVEPGQKVLFTASRLVPKNGVGDIVAAIPLLGPEYRLLIAGSGELERAIGEQISAQGPDRRVTMLGNLTQSEVVVYLNLSHLFVRPSRAEGLGNVFLESMAAGVPVVATMVGGIVDFLVPGTTGMAAEPGNPDSIAEAVRAYEDAALYAAIRDAGLAMVQKRYGWETVAAQMRQLLV